MTQVFISYSRKDISFVDRLAADLKKAGLDVWYDVSGIAGGDRWSSEIENALRNSRYVLVVLSPDSINSEWVEREFLFSSNLKRKIIPLMYRPCELPLNYVNLNYIDLQGENYARNFDELLKVLHVDPTTVPVRLSNVEKSKQRSGYRYLALIGGGALLLAILLIPPFKQMFTVTPDGITRTGSVTLVHPSTNTSMPTSLIFKETSTPIPTKTIMPTIPLLPAEITDAKGVKMMLVPAGEFLMGSTLLPDQMPVHVVYLDTYYIDAFEVTNSEYLLCVLDNVCLAPKDTPGTVSHFGVEAYADYPVVLVDWNRAKVYCEWRGEDTRLPTEAEWEKSARGTSEREYPWGSEFSCVYGNFQGCTNDLVTVNSKSTGKSPYGAYNMAGNVWEWVSDWYDATFYESADATLRNPTGPKNPPDKKLKVLRGGSFQSGEANARTTYRYFGPPEYYTNGIGIRCAKSVAP